MSRRRRFRLDAAWVRRGVQLLFLALFIALILMARPIAGQDPPRALQLYFAFDPLILLLTWLAAHAVPVLLLLALVTLLLTVVLGRVFCGWICPLGTIHGLAGRFFDLFRRRRRKEHWSRWQLAKYVVLAAVVVMAVLGLQWIVLLDPLVIVYRSTTVGVLPALQWAVEEGSTAIYQSDPTIGGWHVTSMTEPVYEFFRDHVFAVPGQSFLLADGVLLFFLGIVALNFVRRRFWCRYVCPLGALLGMCSWRPLLTRKVDEKTCNQCDLCGMTCHGAATTEPGSGWKPQECLGCMNCSSDCPRDGLAFTWATPWRRPEGESSLDLSRRGLLGGALGGAAAGLAAVALARVTPEARGKVFRPNLIRPPGARPEAEFLARCIGCGACMKICPTGGLQPAWSEAGWEGLWTPVLAPNVGYCDYECNRCGHVCPTQAIQPLTLEAKKQVKLGLATVDTSRCLPYAYDRPCVVCEEHCPVPDKAIKLRGGGAGAGGGGRGRGRGRGGGHSEPAPYVDPDLCTGCGICENVCPFNDQPAIRVTSANESRHPENQPILPSFGEGGSPYGF